MLLVNQLNGFNAGGVDPVTIINKATVLTDTANSTTYTFTAAAIGTASATRRVIVAVMAEANLSVTAALTSATIGGISASIDADTGTTTTAGALAAIISATVPTGTTADVVLNFSGTITEIGIKVHAVDNLINVTPIDTAIDISDPLTQTIDWQEGGYVFGAASTKDNTDTCTWTGLTSLHNTSPAASTFSSADLLPTSTAAGQTVTADWAVAVNQVMAVASYR
jgi:hypothetical protein